MVLVGLLLGVVIAVVVAVQGCGQHHPRKRAAPPVSVVPYWP
jgi:hypothetical protein